MLRIGIIGFGGAGQAHLRYFDCIPGCRVTKVLDPKPGGRDRARATGRAIEIHETAERFWPDLDAVSVCSPDATHAEWIVQSLGRNLHTVCEKPLTDSVEGIRAIRRAAQHSTAVVAVVHQMRFVPLHQKMRDAVRAGELGIVSYLEGYYVHDLRERAFVNDDWRRQMNATPMVYCGCHFVDLLRWISGEEVIEAFAAANHLSFPEYPESDLNVALLRFRSGALAKVVVSFGSGGPQDHSVRIFGGDATIQNAALIRRGGVWGRVLHEPLMHQPELLARDGVPGLQTRARQLRENLPAKLAAIGFRGLRWLARRPNAEYGVQQYPIRVYEHSLACVGALQDFVDAIRQQRAPLCSVDESARTVLACLAAVESYRTNRPVVVADLDTVS
jgi:predicted dehydrogenase